MADLRQQLLAAFDLERREHIEALRTTLSRAREGDAIDIREVFRRAHTLKGAARAVNLPAVEAAAHSLEALFSAALKSGALASGDIEPALKLVREIEAAADNTQAPPPATTTEASVELEPAPTEFLRVDAAQMKRVSAAMHELSSDLFGVDAAAAGLDRLQLEAQSLVQDLERAVRDITNQAPAAAPALSALRQRSSALTRALNDAQRAQKEMRWTLSQAAGRAQDEIARVTLAPVSTVFAGLSEMIQDLARAANRDVEMKIDGLDVMADRHLLQTLRDPVIHLLRNALAHGIEPADERKRLGKPVTAEVGLEVTTVAGRMLLRVYDDGRGPDLGQIERAAVERGQLTRRRPHDPPPSEDFLLSLVFEPDFSTAAEVDRLAGRGMGLSVVAEAARSAGGSAIMRRRRPYGAEIIISTPLSTARQSMLLVQDGGGLYALPTYALERVLQLRASDLEKLDDRMVVRITADGNQIVAPIVPLHRVTGVSAAAAPSRVENGVLNIAVLRQGEVRLGLEIEAVVDVRALTAAQIVGPLPDLIAGAVQLERDEVAVVISPDVIFQRLARNELNFAAGTQTPVAAPIATRTILVVDDSVTTRTLEKTILEGQGYRVLLTVDGLDALELLRSAATPVDLIVADVEMPRMDGFQLLQAIKADRQFAAIPIIMMTSRADAEDVRRGLDLGADAYLVKQSFDQRELLETVRQLL